MRRIAVLLLIAAAAALVPASKADAYKLYKHRWYSKTLTYYDATGGRYKDQIKAAASVLNRSGARLRVRSASRRSARVRISLKNLRGRAGEARFTVRRGVARTAQIRLRPDLDKDWPTPAAAQMGTVSVIVHELAHVLGLDHENRRCATMNSQLWAHCNRPTVAYLYRCRILETDDVRGLVRRFGGRVRSVGQELCEAEPAPAPPLGLTATPDPPTGIVNLAWTEGAVPLTRVEVLRKAGGCPTGSGDPTSTLLARIDSGPGQPKTIQDRPATPGSYCYAVVGLGPLGRPGVPATFTLNYLGLAPVADFSAAWNPGRTILQLTDASVDSDGQVVAWSWNFGDGTTSTARNPTKSWNRAGTYTVTLTVTDNSGQTGTTSTTVTIQAGSNRVAPGH